MLKGLHFAHQNGVVHRDIKPSNVMLAPNDSVKITDFGIARLPVSSDVTQMGYTVGTPHYMAPEQEASSAVDGRADLFALSVMFQEILAKVPVTSQVSRIPLSPKGIYITPRVNMNHDHPEPFTNVLQKGLAFKPDERFSSAQEYASAIKVAVNELKKATGGTAASPIVENESTQTLRANQLNDMENMLVNFVGPIASSLIDMYKDDYPTMNKLAVKISEEIPDPNDRENFLRAWKSDDEMAAAPKVDTGKVHTSVRAVDSTALAQPSNINKAVTQEVFMLPVEEIAKVQELYAEYVGPMAEFMVADCLSNASNFDEFVNNLLDSIPSQNEKTDFKIKIRNVSG
jgi:serine/threonine-protein kinase